MESRRMHHFGNSPEEQQRRTEERYQKFFPNQPEFNSSITNILRDNNIETTINSNIKNKSLSQKNAKYLKQLLQRYPTNNIQTIDTITTDKFMNVLNEVIYDHRGDIDDYNFIGLFTNACNDLSFNRDISMKEQIFKKMKAGAILEFLERYLKMERSEWTSFFNDHDFRDLIRHDELNPWEAYFKTVLVKGIDFTDNVVKDYQSFVLRKQKLTELKIDYKRV